ncbi:MAG: hypothetical protein K0Q91_2012 [Fibrobacteria bacterium]|jgi:hypothetical protein|nr:hypothetical protein [Fibrobacteria bacterium]
MPYANSSADRTPPSVCPNCGEDVPARALACPECGADWETGWRDIGYAGGGSADPEDEFNYAEAFDKEFGSSAKPRGVKPLWWITGIALLVIFLFGALRSLV